LDTPTKTPSQDPARIHPIVLYGDPVLETRAEDVKEFDDRLQKLIAEMFASMYSAHGVGLAAPQIGISKRIAVIDCSFKERPEEKIVLVNPEIIHTEGKQQGGEGCLSLPDFRENLTRPNRATVRAQDANGKEFEMTGEGLLARAFIHETDHLNGKLYISYLSSLKRDLMKRKIKKLMKTGEWVYEPPQPM
jgi:peptide deformylase